MDDFILIHEDKDYLKHCQKLLKSYLEEQCKLALHEKTEILSLKTGVEFLGLRFYLAPTGKVLMKLKKQSKERLKVNVKTVNRQFLTKKLTLKELLGRLSSYEGNAKGGQTFKLLHRVYEDSLFK